MGSEVPLKEMSLERRLLLEQAHGMNKGDTKEQLLRIIQELANAASACPRVGCATCSFMSKHEAHRVPQDPKT